MAKEFGLFNDEGLVDSGFCTKEEAETAITEAYSPEDELEALEICQDHEEQANATCEECMTEEDED